MPAVGRVIIGASGSPGSLLALRYADLLARAHHAILVPVLAWEPPGGDRADQVQPSGYVRQVWQEQACQRLRDVLITVWGEVPADPLVQPQVERGPAGWVLVSVASRPGDVLVIGAGRRGTLPRMVFCRVSRYCAARARCPVILVPPPELAQVIGRGRLARHLWHKSLTPDQILRDQGKPATG